MLLLLVLSEKTLGDKIVFPENKSADLVVARFGMTPSCDRTENSWCEPGNYPHETMTHYIKKNTSFNQILDQDSDYDDNDSPNSFVIEVDVFSYEHICPMTIDYIYPKAAMNKAGKFMFIVNRPAGSEEYFQLVKVSLCYNPGGECGSGRLFSSVSTICMQEYTDHKLVALSETGQELVVDTFSFPSCCTCRFKEVIEL